MPLWDSSVTGGGPTLRPQGSPRPYTPCTRTARWAPGKRITPSHVKDQFFGEASHFALADTYVLALTEPDLTIQMLFTGWRFGLGRCEANLVDPGSIFAISGTDGEAYIDTQIRGMGSPRTDGLLDCSYSISWPLRYGVTYQVSMAGGSCRLTLLENFLLKEPFRWDS